MQLSRVQVTPENQAMVQTAILCLKHATEEGRAMIDYLESRSKCNDLPLGNLLDELFRKLAPLIHQSNQSISTQILLGEQPQLSAKQVWGIARILQQAVQNAIQHAGPSAIQISAWQDDDLIVFEVSDNGVGFDYSIPHASGFGLNSMCERAKSLDGSLEIITQPNAGTRIRLSLPRTVNSQAS